MSGTNGVRTKKRTKSTGGPVLKTDNTQSKQLLRTEKLAERSRRASQISRASTERDDSDADSDDLEDEKMDINGDLEEEKDEAELELERLVFGDSKGFMDSIQTFGKQAQADTLMRDDSAEGSDDDEDMQGQDVST